MADIPLRTVKTSWAIGSESSMYKPEWAYRSEATEWGTRNEGLYMRSFGKEKTRGPFSVLLEMAVFCTTEDHIKRDPASWTRSDIIHAWLHTNYHLNEPEKSYIGKYLLRIKYHKPSNISANIYVINFRCLYINHIMRRSPLLSSAFLTTSLRAPWPIIKGSAR